MVGKLIKLLSILSTLASCGCNPKPYYDPLLVGYWEEFSNLLNTYNIPFNSNLKSLTIGDCDLSDSCGGVTIFSNFPWESPEIALDKAYYLRYKGTKVIKVIMYHEFIHAAFNYTTHDTNDFNLMNPILPMQFFLDTRFDVDGWLELEVLKFGLKYK